MLSNQKLPFQERILLMKLTPLIFTLLITLCVSSTAFAQMDWIKKNIDAITEAPAKNIKQTSLSETEIGKGLKEAIKVGINNTVSSVSKAGGYFDNENIKIPLPKKLKFLDSALRKVGMGDKIDEFVLSMNQAAESAAPAARDIFLDALFDMNIDDAQKIFQQGDTSATDYFKEKTHDKLASAFQPTIDKALEQYDVTDKYNALLDKYKTIPFAGKINMLSPDQYVVEQALDGLFLILGQEETKIRQNPAARVTDILKKVFK